MSQPNSFISRVGEGRQERERTLRPRGPGWCLRLCLPLLGSVRRHCPSPGALPSLCSCPARGGGHSDFNGSRPSQQHFGLRRDTERRRLREVKAEGRKRERQTKRKEETEGRGQTAENRRRTQRRNQTTRKFVSFPSSILFCFLIPFFPVFFFFKAFSVDWGGGELRALHPCP